MILAGRERNYGRMSFGHATHTRQLHAPLLYADFYRRRLRRWPLD